MRALIKREGFFLRIGGKTNNQLYAENAVSLCLEQKWVNYIKKLENFRQYVKDADNQENKPNSLGDKLAERQEKFGELEVKDQVHVLLELLKITQCQNMGMNVKEILDLSSSRNVIGKEITRQDEFLLINQSVTGIYTSRIDLKTV